jgi:CRISPR-associated protein Csm3
MASIQLHGKIFLECNIRLQTGLHIGGNSGNLDIGGVDNPIIRDPITTAPYIPGSSLRGKIRGLLDRHLNKRLNNTMSNVTIHMCKTPTDYYDCHVCQVFGVAPTSDDMRGNTMPTRLIIRDVFLEKQSQKELEAADTDTNYTEIKTEVAIDRITSEANPRPNERVPAGAIFGPVQIVHSLYTQHGSDHDNQLQDEVTYFDTVLKGMELLVDDYLGGSGSRGSGQITFENLTMTFKSRECYEKADVSPRPITLPENADIKALRQSNYIEQIQNAISGE